MKLLKILKLTIIFVTQYFVNSQIVPSSNLHPALYEGPQNEVFPSLFFPKNRVGSKNQIRSRVFRDASQGYKQLVDSPRLYRASGRFHKRVQSATTHDIQNFPLPSSDTFQIVNYNYEAEKHDEKKMATNDIISNAEAEDHARGIERTTMAVKVRTEQTYPLTSTTPVTITTTTQMPENNSINDPQPSRQKTFFQTVTANGAADAARLPHQPPVVFSPQPPIAAPAFPISPLLGAATIQQQNLPLPSSFGSVTAGAIPPPINIPPHQPTNPLTSFQPPPPTPTSSAIGLATNPTILQPQPVLSKTEDLETTQSGNNHEQLGCGWDWLTNSCKDVFNLNWCGKCHDFGNIFLHDCKCVAPLIPIPTTPRPTPPPPPSSPQLAQASQRHPIIVWLN